jgi:hypothetical protein
MHAKLRNRKLGVIYSYSNSLLKNSQSKRMKLEEIVFNDIPLFLLLLERLWRRRVELMA